MGYNLTIGNAVLDEPCSYTHEYRVYVEGACRPDAPAFGEPTDGTSTRWPSYSVWSRFCDDVGLRKMFYEEESGLLARHPGVSALTPSHLAEIVEAVSRRRATNGGRRPGFFDEAPDGTLIDNGTDEQLARLVWLEYWVQWALENCERPAFGNS